MKTVTSIIFIYSDGNAEICPKEITDRFDEYKIYDNVSGSHFLDNLLDIDETYSDLIDEEKK